MIFELGKNKKEVDVWYDWFAWRPVIAYKYDAYDRNEKCYFVWLEKIQRREWGAWGESGYDYKVVT
jgi:hypothetical protein